MAGHESSLPLFGQYPSRATGNRVCAPHPRRPWGRELSLTRDLLQGSVLDHREDVARGISEPGLPRPWCGDALLVRGDWALVVVLELHTRSTELVHCGLN